MSGVAPDLLARMECELASSPMPAAHRICALVPAKTENLPAPRPAHRAVSPRPQSQDVEEGIESTVLPPFSSEARSSPAGSSFPF